MARKAESSKIDILEEISLKPKNFSTPKSSSITFRMKSKQLSLLPKTVELKEEMLTDLIIITPAKPNEHYSLKEGVEEFESWFKQTDQYVTSTYDKVLSTLKKLSLNSDIVKDESSKTDLYMKKDEVKFPAVAVIIAKSNVSKHL